MHAFTVGMKQKRIDRYDGDVQESI